MTEKIKLELKEKQLIIYAEMLKNKSPKAEILEKAGISRATFYRWKKNYKCCGIAGLKELSRRPHRTREKSALTNEAMEAIKQARLEHPMYGKAKIRAVLRKAGIMLSESSIGRALRHFMRRGTVEPVNALKCRKERKTIRKFTCANANRIPKGYKSPMQLDHTIIGTPGGRAFRVFAAYDRESRICLFRAYSAATSGNAAKFMEYVLNAWPCEAKEIQTDGGSEFMGEFDEFNREHGITHYVLPPRSPEMNGGVERFNQTLQDEYILQYWEEIPEGEEEFNRLLEHFQNDYNYNRPHRSLKGSDGLLLTPMEYLKLKSLICYEP